jgi:hypothetical protein
MFRKSIPFLKNLQPFLKFFTLSQARRGNFLPIAAEITCSFPFTDVVKRFFLLPSKPISRIPVCKKMEGFFFFAVNIMSTVLYICWISTCGKGLWKNLWRLWKSYRFQQLLGVFPIQAMPMNIPRMYV